MSSVLRRMSSHQQGAILYIFVSAGAVQPRQSAGSPGACVRVEAGIPGKHSFRAFAAALLLDPSETNLVATGNRGNLSP